VIFSQGGGVPPPYHHPMAMYVDTSNLGTPTLKYANVYVLIIKNKINLYFSALFDKKSPKM
jgi:hypothetical protein